MKFAIVGCGLSGITSARLLKDQGHEVQIFESRNHIGGNCYDSNVCGTIMHNYGPHIFHTDDEEVFKFLSKYTEWTPLHYRPIGRTIIGDIPLPYSDKGCEEAIGFKLTEQEVVDLVFCDYSEKQWGVPFNEIPSSITNRIPKTKGYESPTWFEGQKYQCVPKEGYTKMFEKMLDGIEIFLGCSKNDWKNSSYDRLIYTGKIDEYFDNCYGSLPYRTLDFEHKVTSKKQNTLVFNECNYSNPWTRQYDHSYFTTDHSGLTVITREYSRDAKENDIPFYPIPWGDPHKKYKNYKALADKEKNTIFLGRLAQYKYLDMWMAIKHAFLKIKKIN
jgi:UDP-galactopyranose mutase